MKQAALPYGTSASSFVHCSDVAAYLATVPDNTFHGMLSDPPYGLSFMGKAWDKVVPPREVWRETLRVLRPGAYALVFGGTRTFHRLACALEDAGFEVRDCLCYLYGSGFPKSADVSKSLDNAAGATRKVVGSKLGQPGYSLAPNEGERRALGKFSDSERECQVTAPATDAAREWQGYGTALKPAWEPILLVRKPLDGTVARNVQRWGCGALAIDACRIGTSAEDALAMARCNSPGSARHKSIPAKEGAFGRPSVSGDLDTTQGRFPANVLLDVDAARVLDAEVGDRPSTLTGRADPSTSHEHPASPDGTRASMFGNEKAGGRVYADGGGPSRFFYTAKVSKRERNAGVPCDHPTLKPVSLTTYLARLLLAPVDDACLLVPYAGAGSEMAGALRAGWPSVVGIEKEARYVAMARERIAALAEEAAE